MYVLKLHNRRPNYSTQTSTAAPCNQSKTATCESSTEVRRFRVDYNILLLRMLVLFAAMEAGCFREVATLYTDHIRQV